MRTIVLAARDTPAARADVWGSPQEQRLKGGAVAARPQIPLRGGLFWHMGVVWAGTIGGGTATNIRLWTLTDDDGEEGDWDLKEATREWIRRLVGANKIRAFVQREGETSNDLWLRVKAALQLTAEVEVP